ncbi:MAG TPA: SDR family oxidoreductase [Bryobacteraceae bacterium]|nr:SDR family oxidoreductase [Bryobacteraceae bacterium]
MPSANGTKVALVTGANKGIGYEIARGLAGKGMRVLLACRDLARAEAAAAKLKQERLNVFPVLLDVTRRETIASAAADVEKSYGKLDVLVNNAGIAREWGSKPSNTDIATVREIYDTNLFGAIAMIQTMLPLLLRSEAGRIVNVSSSLGSLQLTSDPSSPMSQVLALGYCSSKSALNAVTVQFANELKSTPVKVNAVCPGYVATDLNNHSGPRTPEQGARIAIEMATIGADGPTGGYFEDGGRVPW